MSVTVGQSALLYQERRQPQNRPTLRGPGPRIYLEHHLAKTQALAAPLPLPSLLADVNGTPPPDAGLTVPWPPSF